MRHLLQAFCMAGVFLAALLPVSAFAQTTATPGQDFELPSTVAPPEPPSTIASHAAHAQQVWIGVSDNWRDLTDFPDKWTFVQQNADGLYVNFIELNRVIRHMQGYPSDILNKTCELHATHKAYLSQTLGQGLPDGSRERQEANPKGHPAVTINITFKCCMRQVAMRSPTPVSIMVGILNTPRT